MSEEDPIFNNSSVYMKSLLGKTVEIETLDKKVHSGVLYVIDPIFKSVVLHTNWKSNDDYDTIMIMYHAITSLEVIDEEIKENYVCTQPTPLSDNSEKKSSVKKWLKHMMIDVKESGDYLKIDDFLIIVPPYKTDNCICNNTIILERIQKILEMMPEDFS